MGKIRLAHTYNDIIGLDNLLEAWREFVVGKQNRADVQVFSLRFMDNILSLHRDLCNRVYCHGGYHAFKIVDPKPRDIHKATVRDRLVHHAVYRVLYPFFDRTFITDSYSCREGKGVYRALDRFQACARKESRNNTRTCWVLKCDIRKFFASIDHKILLEILTKRVADQDILWLLSEIIGSFHTLKKEHVGLPLGNLTSQLFANIYLNELDQFVKHQLKAKYYIRYADDFVILSHDKVWLKSLLPLLECFLTLRLRLTLHPDKVFIQTLSSGVDFLGWVKFPNHRVLRTVTKRRMLRAVSPPEVKQETLRSYLGMLSHGNAEKLMTKIKAVAFILVYGKME